MKNVKEMCDECARKDTDFCLVCDNGDSFITKKENDELNALCDLMCGKFEEY